MKLNDFDYYLPDDLIAQKAIEPRDSSKMLVLDKNTGGITHKHFFDIINYLSDGDILVLNNSKVFPARLIGKKATGGQVEILLNHEVEPGLWEVLGKNVKVGQLIVFNDSDLTALIEKKIDDIYQVKFNLKGEEFFKEIEQIGETPLPPYIKRDRQNLEDKKRYQTVFAKDRGSAAAPTAGLHFTPELLEQIKNKGVKILEITLHVGLGTFAPVKIDDPAKHKMHSEYYSVKKEVIGEILKTKKEGGKIFAVGTTTTRVLEHVFKSLDTEHWVLSTGLPASLSGWTDIFIYPGFKFQCVDALITNFHLPKSTLLMLVSAFADRENIFNAYNTAVKEEYRFFSYGDAMLIIRSNG